MLVCFYLAACSCSVLHDVSEDCELGGAQTTLRLAGMESEGLSIIESCVTYHSGAFPTETRTVVASGSRDAVMVALESGGVDPIEATSSFDDALQGPESFDVAVTPRGEEWQQGERLAHRSALSGHDLRYRYFAWGKQAHGDQYLLMLRLGTEIS